LITECRVPVCSWVGAVVDKRDSTDEDVDVVVGDRISGVIVDWQDTDLKSSVRTQVCELQNHIE
jgi:hypothetical protein